MILIFIVIFLIIVSVCFVFRKRRLNTIAFFHLNCSSGGGGERVLWQAIKIIIDRIPDYTVYVYTHKNADQDTYRILKKVRDVFKIDLLDDESVQRIKFIPLTFSRLTDAKNYPFLTLFFQSVGSLLVGLEAAWRFLPQVYIETIGFTFTLPVFRLLGCTIVTYVHYPVISTDMVKDVKTSVHASFNNRQIFVKSPLMRNLKLFYYKILSGIYGAAGRCAHLVMVNSRWTQKHIGSIWNVKPHVVYPPCDVRSLEVLGHKKIDHWTKVFRSSAGAQPIPLNIVSIAQFRPEKNHQLQIEAFDAFIHETRLYDSKLTLFGGCRDKDDLQRVEQLRELVNRLDLSSYVDIIVNAPFVDLLKGLEKADVAIHTMENEHFGIVVVEFMAAGLITIAHDSGGPSTDIIDNHDNGLLAKDLFEYKKALIDISEGRPAWIKACSRAAVEKSQKFSAQEFENTFYELLYHLLPTVPV